MRDEVATARRAAKATQQRFAGGRGGEGDGSGVQLVRKNGLAGRTIHVRRPILLHFARRALRRRRREPVGTNQNGGMQATMFHGPGDVRWEEAPDPELRAPHQAIVQVIAGCVCGSDLWHYRGISRLGRVPRTIGHECIGEVVEVGTEVRRIRVGDRVVVPFCQGCGRCANCLAGVESACVEYHGTASGQAELTVASHADQSLAVVSNGDPALLPALLALSDVMATGWHAAVSAKVRPGSTVVVVGDGAVGLCGVLAASTLGAERIIAMSRHESRQQVARRFGATHLVAERGDDAAAAIAELTDGVGADAVLECVGTAESLTTAFAAARPGATVGVVGVPYGGGQFPAFRAFEKNIGLAGGVAPVQRYLPDLLARVEAGTLDAGPVFDRTLPMAEVAEAYRLMDEREAIKVMLLP